MDEKKKVASKLKWKKRELRFQAKVRELLIDGDSTSRLYRIYHKKLVICQVKLYKLACKPLAIKK